MTSTKLRANFAEVALVAVVFFTSYSLPSSSAEVGCLDYYSNAFPEERAAQLWPSGRRPTKTTCSTGSIRGSISAGDFEKFVTFYRAHHPFMNVVFLHSAGGNVREAIKIGRLLRRYLIEADAPRQIAGHRLLGKLCDGPDCVCASACALIWFGAPARAGGVGLHRPYSKDAAFGALSAEEASKQYQDALRGMSTYLSEMGAPKSVVETMTSTSSADVAWIDDGVLEGVSIGRDAGFDEWVRANCQTLGNKEYNTMLALSVASRDRGLNAEERAYLDRLEARDLQSSTCEHRLVSNNRDELPPP